MNSALTPKRFHVVIPGFNCGDFIGQCLDSLQSQTFTNWTALVANDCSNDNTASVAAEYAQKDNRISVRTGDERAWLMGNTLNALRSLDLAPNDVVAILDGDDWIMPDCLEKLWQAHCQGYDLAYTDEEIEGQDHSIAAPLIPSVPVRKQTWCFSQLRTFKGYLFNLLEDATFRDREGRYFRAAGDLALYLPMAELAGPDKVRYIPELLYHYRVHESCNFKVMRKEQLRNNWEIRNRPALERQAVYFDYTKDVQNLDKGKITEVGRDARKQYPSPYTINIRHHIPPSEMDSWRAYHNLWINDGVFFSSVIDES